MPRHSFIQMSKLSNVKGRISYITSQARQENLYMIIMVWQSHLSGEVRAIVPVTQNHFDFA